MIVRQAAAPIALAAALLATTAASAAPDNGPGKSCFANRDWRGWSAPGDGNVLYILVGMHDIYRVELTLGAHVSKDPGYFLINRVRGSDWICSPLDLDLTLSDHMGFRVPLIARSLRKLAPAEVDAIPRKDRPG
jgi:hypothetical protein